MARKPKRFFQYKKPRNDLTNRDFGRWHVVRWEGCKPITVGGVKRTRSFWFCECVCGKTRSIEQSELIKPHGTVSCGCFKRDRAKQNEHKAWKGHGGVTGTFWCAIRRDAARRNIPFEITIEQAWKQYQKQRGLCALTGLPISLDGEGSRGSRGTASLDRVRSDVGYRPSNVQWLHKDVNIMKNTYDQDYFIGLCCKIAELQRGKDVRNSSVL